MLKRYLCGTYPFGMTLVYYCTGIQSDKMGYMSVVRLADRRIGRFLTVFLYLPVITDKYG